MLTQLLIYTCDLTIPPNLDNAPRRELPCNQYQLQLQPAGKHGPVRLQQNALLLDTRNAALFSKGFIPDSINIGLDGSFAPWVGSLIPYKGQPILFIADEGREEEVITRLARIGYDDTIGYLKGGFDTWQRAGKPIEQIESVSANDMAQIIESGVILNILDVRKESEFSLGHVSGARNLPLDAVNELQASVDKAQRYYVHCAAGYRSMVFISILKARGYQHLVDVQGGFNALKVYPALVADQTN